MYELSVYCMGFFFYSKEYRVVFIHSYSFLCFSDKDSINALNFLLFNYDYIIYLYILKQKHVDLFFTEIAS